MRARALIVAVLTTLLWSGSYIVNKVAFAQGIGPLTLSGLRYTIGGVTLMLALRCGEGKRLPLRLGFFQGFLCYLIGQGFQYIGQSLTNPTMASLILHSGLVLVVVAADRIRLHEAPGKSLYWKAALLIGGMVAYYTPRNGNQAVPMAAWLILGLAAVGAGMNVVLNRVRFVEGYERRSVTVLPMLSGGMMMLAAGLATEAPPSFTWELALCVAYLAFVSGAIGFGLWVWTQQTLKAVESCAINNAMVIEIAVMDVLFFHRILGAWQWIGILIVFLAINLLQIDTGHKFVLARDTASENVPKR